MGEHGLPAVVLASVCGHFAGSASYLLDAAMLGRAIALLAPAEACVDVDHPNLASWRRLHAGLDGQEGVVVVFLADVVQPSDDPHVVALREALSAG